jgi:hypothetical protein
MTLAERLKAQQTAILDNIDRVLSKPRPNYSVDGKTVSYADYLKMLYESLDVVNAQIQGAEPFEIFTPVK